MTLEKSKGWGLEERTQTLTDKARTRLNNPTPHQAPQRERVSLSAIPGAQRAGSAQRRRRRGRKHWKELLRPDVNMGVPQLMMILEPNIVWEHTQAFVGGPIGKELEAHVTPGEFLEGWHKGGRSAYGVYEGNYWELIGDCDEMMEVLRKMSKAPALQEEPPLELPPQPDLPKWDDFKPDLHAIPAAPSLPPLKLPPFRAPMLDTELPFLEPEYLPLPDVPAHPPEDPMPFLMAPEPLLMDPFKEPEYVDPEPPVVSEPPKAPVFGQPKHGHDWSGERPFQLDLPELDDYLAKAEGGLLVEDMGGWRHPPDPMPPLPTLEPLDAAMTKGLDLEPIPKLELAWLGGPEPDPPYASMPATPAALVRHASAAAARPPSAAAARSRPPSAAPPASRSQSAAPSRPMSAAPTRPQSAVRQPEPERDPSPPLSARGRPSEGPSAAAAQPSEQLTPEQQAWEEVRSIPSEASGAPRAWLNFEKPFAELPPILMPPQPVPGPEPRPEDFPHDALEELPAFVTPQPRPLPAWREPEQYVPAWQPPSEPRPVGFLRGAAPVIICDVSGTMNPRQQGKFRELKRCAIELLDPEGELATAAAAFDLVTFCSGAWSWSAGYGERLDLLASSQVLYQGRQAGGRMGAKGASAKSPPGSPTKPGIPLQPTSPELLADAQRWLNNWPDAVGTTSLLAAFSLADQHWAADCWYVLSDGLAHDPQQCVDYLEARSRHGLHVPAIHAVGFMADDAPTDSAGERFLKTLAALTGGSYQRYTPNIVKVWQPTRGFVPFDVKGEKAYDRTERVWAEQQLRAERKKNIRLGIVEPLDVTVARVQAMHEQVRALPAVRENAASLERARAAHAAETDAVLRHNETALERAQEDYEEGRAAACERNSAKVEDARQAFLAAFTAWESDYLARLSDWEAQKALLERQRDDELAAMAAGGGGASALGSFVRRNTYGGGGSAGGSRAGSRPTSASVRYGPAQRSPSISPRRPESAARAAAAATAYDVVHGIDMVQDKLSPNPSPPGSRPVSGARPRSAAPPRSRPRSARPMGQSSLPGAPGADDDEYLDSIAEDLANPTAPIDTIYEGDDADGEGGVHEDDGDGDGDGGILITPRLRELQQERAASSAGASTSGRTGGGYTYSAGGRQSRQGSAAGAARARRSSSEGGMAAAPGGGGSGRASARGGSRPVSARPLASAGSAGRLGLGLLAEGSAAPAAPPLPEPSAVLAPLPGESSEEFKRRILPADVVSDLDGANAARLGELRAEWEALLAEDAAASNGMRARLLARNAAKMAEFRSALHEAYADGLIKDIVFGSALRAAANAEAKARSREAYEAELARVLAENQRLREAHAAEVADKVAKEEVHAQAYGRWQAVRDQALARHEAERARAREAHATNVDRLRAEWQAKKAELDELNEARRAEAEALHATLVESVREANRRHRAEHAELLRHRKEVETENLSRQAEAKAAHKLRLDALERDNQLRIKQSQEEHQAMCVRLQEEHEEARVQAEADFAQLKAFLRQANEQLTDEARKRYQEALAEAQAAYEEECVAAREVHERELARVRAYNQDILPRVQVARLALAELARVQAFAEHIKLCANKFEMGVNYLPNTPNYDRVVEMASLTEALARAFPDMQPAELPWPDQERRLEPGSGWVAAPATHPLTYRDPAAEVMRIAAGKTSTSAGGAGSPRTTSPRTTSCGLMQSRSMRSLSPTAAAAAAIAATVSAAAALASMAAQQAAGQGPDPSPVAAALQVGMATLERQYGGSAGILRPVSAPVDCDMYAAIGGRPLSAGRARFASVVADMTTMAAGQQGSGSAGRGALQGGPKEAWSTSAISLSGGGAGGPGGGAPGLVRSSSGRPLSAVGNPAAARIRSASHAANKPRGAATNAGAVSAAAAAAAAAAYGRPPRPVSGRPQSGRRPPSGLPARPMSAGAAPRPARVAVDVAPLQASIARAKAQAGQHSQQGGAKLAGFVRDVPKLRYPEVDVQQVAFQ